MKIDQTLAIYSNLVAHYSKRHNRGDSNETCSWQEGPYNFDVFRNSIISRKNLV